VYPSAFHISWWPPERYDERSSIEKRRPYIAALAVDVEPAVFWSGKQPNPSEVFDEWARAVGFTDDYGRATPSGSNGPSGAGLVDRYLAPLGISPDEVSFTDVVPTFFVKHGAGSQGDAISKRFAPIAAKIGVHEGSLPARPSPAALVRQAVETQRERLRSELRAAGAPVVITLGQEAADVIRQIVDSADGAQTKLAADGYGRRGSISIDGYGAAWLPLAHPGVVRPTHGQWSRTHKNWESQQRKA
jgi:uracil-DNA glycosylase